MPGAVALLKPDPSLVAVPHDAEVTDENLLLLHVAGEPDSFRELLERHQPWVYRFLLARVRSPELAEELCQDVFLRVSRGAKGFRGKAKLSTWIFRIATNVALKRRKRRRVATVSMEAVEPPSHRPDPSVALHQAERRELLHRALDQLPEPQRAVVVLRGLEGLSFQEVANVLGIQRPTAESRMARAKQKLRTILGQQLDEAPRGDDE